jgi:hypothetical protein
VVSKTPVADHYPLTNIHYQLLSPRNHRNGHKSGDHSDGTGAAEVLVQKDAGQHNGNGGIEGTEHDRSVQASDLSGADEDDAAGDVEDSG